VRHRVEHNTHPAGTGVTVNYDKVRVALGLAHMADNLAKYATKVSCPVAILRGSQGGELTLEQAKSVAGFWKNATVIDVEGNYALEMENPAGLAEALIRWSA
jgi:2-(acetamidomethylene)succinate hydrolase